MPGSPPPTTDQRRAVKDVLDGPERQRIGDVYYVLSQKWWAAWRQHVAYEKSDSSSSLDLAGLSLTRTTSVEEGPGPITNEPLGVSAGSEFILREGLVERDDYVLLPEKAWELLTRWYGRDYEFKALVVQGASSSDLTLEVFPLRFDVRIVDGDGAASGPSTSVQLSRSDKVSSARRALEDSTSTRGERRVWVKPASDESFEGEKTGAPRSLKDAFWGDSDWRLLEGDRDAMVGGVPSIHEDRECPRWGALVEARTGGEWPRDLQREKWRSHISVGDTIDAKDSEGRWFDSRIVEVDRDRVKVHYNGWSSRWDNWCDRKDEQIQPHLTHTDDWRRLKVGDALEMRGPGEKALWYKGFVKEVDGSRVLVSSHTPNVDKQWLETASEHICKLGTHIKAERDPKPFARSYSSSSRPSRSHVRGQPPARGAVGLQNLGNTCFMNSMLQCLSHTRPLTDYFLRDEEGEPFYVRQINEKNPLGSGGDLARAYAGFIRDAWSGSYSTVTPSALKRAVSGWKSQFSGYQQQDSQELMMALLDGLHEDLNEIIQKPYVEQLESKGEPDHELAKESWRRFGLRNKSVVMDHCMGQLKSHITCDKCGHESILFDPYNHISLPLPAAGARRVTCTLFKKHSSSRPLKVIVAVQAKDTVGALKQALAKVASLDGSALDLCDVWGHRVYRTFSDNFSVEHIKANDELVAFELGERERAIDVLCGRVSRYASVDRQSPYELFGRPLRIAVTSSTTCGEVRNVVKQCTKRFASESSYVLRISTAAGTRFESDLGKDDELLPKEVATLTLEFKSDEGYDEDESDKVEEHASCLENGHRDIKLEDCFRKFAEKEQLGETEMWYCGKCKEHQRAYKKLDLWSAPEILILHLKRFQYAQNTYFVHRQKLDDRVAFPVENLDLSPHVLDPESRRSAQYDLYAVSEHSGGLGGGHYTATAKDDNTGVWYHYNDSVVSRADGVQESDPKAYVLFYKRRPGKSS